MPAVREPFGRLPDGTEILYVDQVESDNPVQVRDWTGTRAPMHAVPWGLVLLAEWPEDALAAYLRAELASLTRRTETDPPRLRKRLATARKVGYAWGLERKRWLLQHEGALERLAA